MNTGNLPIASLDVLYPRSMYHFQEDSNAWFLRGVADSTPTLPIRLAGVKQNGNKLELRQPDPNRPQFDREPLLGQFLPGDSRIAVPDLTSWGLALLDLLEITYFEVVLDTPINPLESRWLSFTFKPMGIGILSQTPIGKIAIHQLASPADVRHTVEEKLEGGLRQAETAGGEGAATTIETVHKLNSICSLNSHRRVEIEYYELAIDPGKASERFLLSSDVERDLRMRSNSPREVNGRLLYEWKSGSILRPDGYPWKNEGFILHLKLVGV